MIRLILGRTHRQLLRSISHLHNRASSSEQRAALVQDRIVRALAMLDERGVPQDDALRLTLKGDLL